MKKILLTIERDENGLLHGRANVNNNLIICVSDTEFKLTVDMNEQILNWENVDPETYEFNIVYE